MKSKLPLVTVLLPCYNAKDFLKEAIDSICNQTYKNLEILCINDGSSDNTGALLDAYAAQDSRIRVVHNEVNLKLIGTLNKGVSLARGKYIARMDADDISLRNRIERLIEIIEKDDCDVVSCNFNFIDQNGNQIKTNLLRGVSKDEVLLSSFLFTPIGHACLLGKREAFVNNPYSTEDTSIHTEDYELWSRMLRNGLVLKNIDEILYSFRINQESVSHQFEALQIENFAKCAQNHYNEYFKTQIPLEVYSIVVNRFEFATIGQIRRAFEVINKLKKHFEGKVSDKRIGLITDLQKIDILIQATRKGKGTLKFSSFLHLIGMILKNSMKKDFRKYLNDKRMK